MYFSQCWRARHRIVFVEKFYDFAFQGLYEPSKGDEQGSDNRLL